MANILTDKENTFCMAVCDGYTQRDAYILAYRPNTENIASLDTMASRLAARQDVKDRIEELRNRRANTAQYTDINDINKRYSLIWERIAACQEKGDDTAIGRYLDIINKMTGTYQNNDKKEEKENTLVGVTTDQLKALLDNPPERPKLRAVE